MKKLLCLTLVIVMTVCALSSCALMEKIVMRILENAESPDKVDEMMAALADDQIDDAKVLMHPDVTEDVLGDSLEAMATYLDGRIMLSKQVTSLSVKKNHKNSQKVREESISYNITLSDETVITVETIYISDENGAGFTTFRLALGVM